MSDSNDDQDKDVRKQSRPRGVGIVISNKFRNDNLLKERFGTGRDREIMVELLKSMGCEIMGQDKDYGVKDMKELFAEASEKNFNGMKFCVCVILSYGSCGSIHAQGKQGDSTEIEVEELLDYFKGKKCPSLAGVPKLCFIQTCPEEYKEKFERHSGKLEAQGGDVKIEDLRKLPVEADILKVHSCIPGSCSWSEDLEKKQKPSLFIESLNKTIRDHWRDVNAKLSEPLDILTLMTRVSKNLAKTIRDLKLTKNKSLREDTTIPYVSSSLTKGVFLTEEIEV